MKDWYVRILYIIPEQRDSYEYFSFPFSYSKEEIENLCQTRAHSILKSCRTFKQCAIKIDYVDYGEWKDNRGHCWC